MAVTSPDNLYSPSGPEAYNIPVATGAMQDSVQTALNNIRASIVYRVGTNAQRLALTGVALYNGLRFWTTDTNTDWVYRGSAWVSLNADSGWVGVTVSSGWTATSGYTPQVRKVGSLVTIRGAVTFSSGTINSILTVPTGYRPATNTWLPASHSSAAFNGSPLLNPAGHVSVPTGYYDGAIPSGSALPLAGSWYVD